MAKKKNENTLQYLQMPLPSGGKYSKMTKVAFGGLNKRYTLDSGALTMENNISTNEYPYLVPSNKRMLLNESMKKYEHPIGMFAFENFLLVIYQEQTSEVVSNGIKYITTVKADYIKNRTVDFTGEIAKYTDFTGWKEIEPRSVVQFNVYTEGETGTIIDGTFTKKLLIFPDKKSMYFNVEEDANTKDGTFQFYNMDSDDGTIVTPPIKYATVHLSRVFGVSDDCVFASKFNDYTDWMLDTSGDGYDDDGYDEKNAWMSQTQSNTKADGNFTGIANFQGHIVCFKRDFMHEIYNTKNPFRLVDVYAEGTIDNRTIQDVDGKLIFVSEDGVKIYTGSNPRVIDYNLNMSQYTYAVSGTDNRNYYLYCEDDKSKKYLYVYDTFTELWSEQSIEHQVLSFAHNKNGMYMLCTDGCVYKMDTEVYATEWSFETDLITNKTVDIKHIKKIQMLVELDDKADTNIDVYILYDNETFDGLLPEEKAKHLVYSNETRKRYGKFPIRVKPRNTANYGFKLHIEGSGYVKLYELEIFVEAGGDLYV